MKQKQAEGVRAAGLRHAHSIGEYASYLEALYALVKSQGTTLYLSLALDELELTTVQEVTKRAHFVRRVVALEEESR